jgi:hypothetical protein
MPSTSADQRAERERGELQDVGVDVAEERGRVPGAATVSATTAAISRLFTAV